MNNTFFRFKGGKTVFISLLLIFVCSFIWLADLLPARAEDWAIMDVVPAERTSKLTFTSADKQVVLTFAAGTSTADSYVKFMNYLAPADIATKYPYTDIVPASELYYLELSPQEVDYSSRPKVSIKFQSENKLKSAYYWNDDQQQFIKLNSTRDTKKNILTFEVPAVKDLTFAVFEEPVQVGTASWYVHPRYKKELMAASTDFSFGSQVKVTNLANNKSVIVTIKDYGPVKSIHPDRVIDLGKEAFKKIASTGAGVINVKVEPYLIVTSTATSTIAIKK